MSDVLDVLRETQFPILTAMLLLGAAAKFTDRSARGQGWVALLPVRLRRPAALAAAGAEALLGLSLPVLVGLPGDLARGATAVLFVVAVATLLQLRRRDPEMGCGCFGGVSSTPVGRRSIARAGLLALAAAALVGLPGSGVEMAAGFTAWHGLALAAEAAVLGALSPELKEIARRLAHPVPCELREVPLRRTMARLRSSEAWRANRDVLASTEPVDVWRQGCLRLVRFNGRRRGRPVDVVFGVPVSGRRPAVRAAIVPAEPGAPQTAPHGAPRPRPGTGSDPATPYESV
ncbi:hypothetical protein HDA32_005463 [Spinactinospora alkalitolerans]|uniref:Methylamine utilisation protein MauE domain-containing protein n=1 Tax=Spinactinospora alkalitolerans TaxID=687207 RepID=A0A852U647_9ACTN|nr:MauE/DoxX family redox-associated membrane protein [Spinactinospora alkalitolerans]NYE50343.1 hypothetical protein [Spinactinospora alkalitolerans]